MGFKLNCCCNLYWKLCKFMKNQVLWDITTQKRERNFQGMYCLHLQGPRLSTTWAVNMEAVRTSNLANLIFPHVWATIMLLVEWLGYWPQKLNIIVQFLAETKDFSLLQNVWTGSGTHPVSSSVHFGFLGVKLPGCEADPSPPYSPDVKNEWSCTPSVVCPGTTYLLSVRYNPFFACSK